MNSLTPWEPLDGMISLREALNRLFEDSMVGLGRFEAFGRAIPFDVRETGKDYVVEAALPGFTPEQIQITATADSLSVSAQVSKDEKTERKLDEPAEAKDGTEQPSASKKPGVYVRRERYRGEMTRTMRFPVPIDPDKVSATYAHGELSVTLPKAAQAATKQIPIQVKETPKATPEASKPSKPSTASKA
jgi:HSP20 family protein